ncbi:skin secretory protein xP2-like [Macrobrachium nipponense]|uniref:skin secretory protein xP2-like n=1 Tax=Macrobrachium nipponense TaxID=159736 RepID=UPI0030C8B93C
MGERVPCAQPTVTRQVGLPVPTPPKSRGKGSTSGDQKGGCPSQLKQGKRSTDSGQERLPIHAEAEGRAQPVVTGDGLPFPAEAGGRARPDVGERLPFPAPEPKGRGSTSVGQERLPIPSRSRGKGSTMWDQERLPYPAEAGKSSTVVGQERLPFQPKQGEGLDQCMTSKAAHPRPKQGRGSTSGPGKERLPIPGAKAGGRASTSGGAERLPVPAKAEERARPAVARRGCPSQPKQAEELDQRWARRGRPFPAEAEERARPAVARRGCPSQPKQAEELDQRWQGEADRPSRSQRKGLDGGGKERLPVPAKAGGRARPAVARRGCPSQPKEGEGLDRRWPGEAAHPSQKQAGRARQPRWQERLPPSSRSRGKGSTGGGQERLPVPAEAEERARPAVTRRGCPSQLKQGEEVYRQWPGEAAHPSRSRGEGSTGGDQERLPSQPKQGEELDQMWAGEAALPS